MRSAKRLTLVDARLRSSDFERVPPRGHPHAIRAPRAVGDTLAVRRRSIFWNVLRKVALLSVVPRLLQSLKHGIELSGLLFGARHYRIDELPRRLISVILDVVNDQLGRDIDQELGRDHQIVTAHLFLAFWAE